MHHLKLSIITVVYNKDDTLEKTIQSVLNQNYSEIEYIIIDGNSTDCTVDIIKKFSNSVSFWISEKDNGIYDAMNKGIMHASGDIIAFLNSDDWYLDGALSFVANQFSSNDFDVLFLGVTRENKEGKRIDRYPEIIMSEEGYEYLAVYHPATFVKKNIFEEIGYFDLSYRIAADYEWLVRMKMHRYKIKCMNYVTTYYSDGGVSNRYWFEAQSEAKQIDLKYAQTNEEKKSININYQNKFCYRKYMEILDQKQKSEIFCNIVNLYVRSNKIFIFGAGYMARECLHLLLCSEIEILGFIDNNREKWGELYEGIPIMSSQILNKRNDIVVISSIQYEDDIKSSLVNIGMQINNIITYSFLKDQVMERLKLERNS